MYKRLLIAGLISVVPLGVSADYQFELEAGFGSGDLDFEYNTFGDEDYDTRTTNLSAKGYFSTVSADGVPFREAGFLSKNSYISFDRTKYSVDFSGSSDFDINSQELSGRYVFSSASVILGAGLIRGQNDAGSDEAERNGYSLEAGLYISDDSAVWVSYENVDYSVDDNDVDGEIITTVNFKKVGEHLVWNVMAERFDGVDYWVGETERTSFGGGVKWYFDQKLAIGASLQLDKYSPDDSMGIKDASGAVFTPEISYDFSETYGIYFNIRSEAYTLESDFGNREVDVSEVTTTIGFIGRF